MQQKHNGEGRASLCFYPVPPAPDLKLKVKIVLKPESRFQVYLEIVKVLGSLGCGTSQNVHSKSF